MEKTSFICGCGCKIRIEEGSTCYEYDDIWFKYHDCVSNFVGAKAIIAEFPKVVEE